MQKYQILAGFRLNIKSVKFIIIFFLFAVIISLCFYRTQLYQFLMAFIYIMKFTKGVSSNRVNELNEQNEELIRFLKQICKLLSIGVITFVFKE